MTFLKEAWYAAGFSQDFVQQPVARTLLGVPMVLYRTESGRPVVLHDACPHRFAPLHAGKVFGEDIRCPYHGLRFDSGGRCVHNPLGKGEIPGSMVVPSYPLEEVDGIVWLWYGEGAPDLSKIVRFAEFGQPDAWATVQGYLPVAASYTLVSDNLLDLSHAEFLHPALASEGFNRRVQPSVSVEGDDVVMVNIRKNEPTSRLFQMSFGENAPDHVDHRSIVRWSPPAVLRLEVGATPVDCPESEGVTTITSHLITPESETSCHYFWKIARDFKLQDEAFGDALREAAHTAYANEDRPMMEAQQRNIDSAAFSGLKPRMLKSDTAAVMAGRILERRLSLQAG